MAGPLLSVAGIALRGRHRWGQTLPSPDNDAFMEMSCHKCRSEALAAISVWLGAISWHFPGCSHAAGLGVFGGFLPTWISVSPPLLSSKRRLYGVRWLQCFQRNLSHPGQDMEGTSWHTEGQTWKLFLPVPDMFQKTVSRKNNRQRIDVFWANWVVLVSLLCVDILYLIHSSWVFHLYFISLPKAESVARLPETRPSCADHVSVPALVALPRSHCIILLCLFSRCEAW